MMHKKHNKNYLATRCTGLHFGLKKQQGVVLIWAVVFLLVITIIGLSTVRMTSIDTQISGNSVTTMLTYQGAESALGKTAPDTDHLYHINKAAEQTYLNSGWDVSPGFFLPEQVSGGGVLTSVASVQVEEKNIDCPLNMPATSSILGCHVFRVDVSTRLQGTGAQANHTVGLANHAP